MDPDDVWEAYADDASKVGTGSSGGGIALLIILGSGILLYLFYSARKKWHRRKLERDNGGQ